MTFSVYLSDIIGTFRSMASVGSDNVIRRRITGQLSGHCQGLLPHQCIDHLLSPLGKQSLDRPPGDPHSLSGLFLVQVLSVTEVESLQFVVFEDDDRHVLERCTGRFEDETEFLSKGADAVALFFCSWRHVLSPYMNGSLGISFSFERR